MFTGIVEELGEVVRTTETGDDSALVAIRGPLVTSDARHGDSIAVNGVCLTVVDVDGDVFTADVMGETLRRSALGALRPGVGVNLERAAALNSRLGGHLVQGHVDGVGAVLSRQPAQQWETVRFRLPAGLSRYVVEKGSITVDGVSLTVADVGPDWFTVGLIPTTLKLTTLGDRAVGDPVNLEVDVLAKYVERLLGDRAGGGGDRLPDGIGQPPGGAGQAPGGGGR
ncbi:riboflavin synthase [Micromonospora carbonacea]|uniref:Riboflavin synthase n=1 Tax=Micromonospora carbonacea TaxID=47853 RepID=A0A7H8XN34_9ACTN|nr:riboflavin synthase [Micromonospora carbonacea]MBB5825698.1 riboflavin synthase [Micromonospora carbonacea]QLD26285.1 riboflavin synthase [Micromonospora carbonacea]